MKQIKIFTGYVDYSNGPDQLEADVNAWLASHTDYAILDIKQSAFSGRSDVILITVFYEVADRPEKSIVKTKLPHYSRDFGIMNLDDNEYMSR